MLFSYGCKLVQCYHLNAKQILSSKINFVYVKLHSFNGNLLCDFREWGYTYKNVHISAASHYRILNLASHLFVAIAVLQDGQVCK